jgi:hypothetical protein
MCGVMILSGLTACRTTTPTTTTTTTSATISATPSLTPTTSTLTTPTATQTTSPTTTDFNGVNSASSTSANGLSLSLSLDSKTYLPGGEISIVIDVKNTLLIENDVPVSDNWSYSNLGLGPCDNGPGGFGYPYGIAIFQGNYTPLNLSTATPLSLYDYSVIVPCPGPMPSTAYDFKPLSDIATVLSSASSFPNSIFAINIEFTEAGYWTGVSPGVTKHDFAPGVYTIVAGDEWGSLVVLHFTVSQDTAGGNSARSLSVNGLRLYLSLDSTIYQPEQQVTIVIDETNMLSKTNNVTTSDKWPLSGLSVSHCGTLNYPFGVAIFQGYYASGDISSATPLKLYDPLAVYSCPMVLSEIDTYAFQPLSDIAAVFQISDTNPVLTENMNVEVQTTGYWIGSTAVTLTNFDPGVYTVVGGDEWGSLLVVHFTVSQ